ncbi:MAG: hypothetical protein YHS30scaffold667_7 [Phage 65_10]|nr:MAG: hypothetical protein YHS30scaffold667_7 [Phage 65_10]
MPSPVQTRIKLTLASLSPEQKRQCAIDAGTTLSYLYRLVGQERVPNPTARVVAALTRHSRAAGLTPITAEDFCA